MSNRPTLLLQERPLIVLPQLACAVGLNEAIVLQQLHYWLIESGTTYGDRRWVYNSYEQWQVDNFPFWSLPTIRRVFGALERDGLVSSRVEYDRRYQGSRRKWYTINYDVVRAKEGEFLNGNASGDQNDHDSEKQPSGASGDQLDQSSRDQNDQTSGDQNDQTLYTENTTENTKTAAVPKNGTAAARAAPKPRKPRTAKRKPAPAAEAKPAQPHVALVDAYLEALDAVGRKPIIANAYSRYGVIATAMQKEGVTPDEVRAFVGSVYSNDADDHYWQKKTAPIPLETVASQVKAWCTLQTPSQPVGTVEYTGWHEAVADPPTLEDRQAKAQRQREEAARLRAAQEAHRERV